MRIIATRKFLKKIIIFLLLIILFFFVKIYPTKALVNTNNGKFPDAPSDAKNYFISYDDNWKVFNIQYCKNDNEVIILDRNVPVPINNNQNYVGQIGYCYNTQTKQRNGNTFRRNFDASDITVNQVFYSENLDLSSKSWGNEMSGTSGTRTFYYNYVNTGRLLIRSDYTQMDIGYNGNPPKAIYTFYANENIYNYKDNGNSISDSDIVLNKNLFSLNQDLTISYELVKRNGYYDLYLTMENYTENTLQDGKGVLLIDTSTGKQTFLSPDIYGLDHRTMVQEVYYATTFKYQIIDTTDYSVLDEIIINVPNVEYDNFYIQINKIDKENSLINYSYVNKGNSSDYICYHQIENGQEIEDVNCGDINNSYNLTLTQNKSVNFIIKDSNNNILFQETRNFVLYVGQPYIQFQENYDYNLLNLKILFNRFNNTNYIAKYQINGGQLVTITPTQESTDIYSYLISNITENSTIKAYIYDNNNNLVASSVYNISYSYINQNGQDNINISNFTDLFKNLSFDNIQSELLNYINIIGNSIMTSKLGTIIFTTFIISLIGLVIKLIRR